MIAVDNFHIDNVCNHTDVKSVRNLNDDSEYDVPHI